MRILLLCIIFCFSSNAWSMQPHRFSAGLILGEPTGLSGRYWLTEKTALDAAAAWSFSDGGAFHVHSDFLGHKFKILTKDSFNLDLFYGGGVRLKFNTEFQLGIRAPIGISHQFEDPEIEFFLELAPILDVVPDVDFYLNAAIGARYYF